MAGGGRGHDRRKAAAGAGGGYVEGMTAQGKYFRLEVPNFNDAAGEEERMSSFLHLGAVRDPAWPRRPSAPKATGEDSAAQGHLASSTTPGCATAAPTSCPWP